jgi:hypothetical protein
MSGYITNDDYSDELRAEAKADRVYKQKLLNHPDCSDPDHPGCEVCEGEDDES